MKKLSILLAMLVVLATGCEQNNNQQNNQQKACFASEYDFFYVQDGEIYFYNVQTQMPTLFIDERDYVVDALCSKDNIVYYNVNINDYLVLKRLDLNVAEPKPEKLADWDVLVEDDEWSGLSAYGDMYFNYDETQIGLERDLHWFAGPYNNLAVYDIASGEINNYELYRIVDLEDETFTTEDLPDESGFDRWGTCTSHKDEQTKFEIEGEVYYIGDGKRICLTDQINVKECIGFDLEEGYDLNVLGVDPTGKRVLIAASTAIGDGEIGIYIVSTLDGKEQMELPGSAYDNNWPEWLLDGSLLYFGYLDQEGLHILEPDNNIRFVAESDTYCVMH